MDCPPLMLGDKKAISAAGPDIVGWKADGIANLPSAWVPNFLVITTVGYRRWREANVAANEADSWPFDSALMEPALRRVAPPTGKILVRSSGVAEDFEARGRFDSRESPATAEALKEAAFYVWGRFVENSTSEDTANTFIEPQMALLVHRAIKPVRLGHLSNERRISRNLSDWLIEEEAIWPADTPRTSRLKIKANEIALRSAPIRCNEPNELRIRLRELATWATSRGSRMHFEWVWDGERCWVVQCDFEKAYAGTVPGQTWTKPLIPPQIDSLRVLVEAENAKGKWQKIEALHIFRICDLATVKVFVLEDISTQQELIRGKITANLKHDLQHLLQLSIVIRSEAKANGSEFPALSPHTPTLSTLDTVSEFLIEQSRKFTAEGIKPGEFCFLLHHFIPAQIGAFSFSRPDNPRVRIDSTWGVPNSLLAYPHDSFEFDTSNPRQIRRQLRCKSQYIYAGEDGKWIPHRCAQSHDWIPSLSDSEIREIAECSLKLSRYLNRAVEIMFFVGVDPASGHPACLPWVIQQDVPDFAGEDEGFRYAGVSFLVDDEIALAKARDWVREHKVRGKVFIKLRPRVDLLRSKKFVEDVAAFAVDQHVPVELEGSVLSHFYYMLWKAGVQIRAVDAFKERTNRRKFGKLVRDKIPVKISLHGETPRVFRLSKNELLPMLKAKAVEEAFELFWETDPSRILEELADLLEVIRSTCGVLGRSPEELEELTALKRKERGGFSEGIVLVETEEVPLMSAGGEESLFAGQPIYARACHAL